jgi:hypothetical protein
MIGLGNWLRGLWLVEDHSEKLIVTLVKAVEAGLQIVLRDIGAETDLPTRI